VDAEIYEEPASDGKHADAAVLDLCFPQEVEWDANVRQAKWVCLCTAK
jgi:hypothetical protein